MKKISSIVLFLTCISCVTKKEFVDCENQFIGYNDIKTNTIYDFFYIEYINSSDTLNFDNSGTDSFFRPEGSYILNNIDEDIISNYKKGVYINNYTLRKIYDTIKSNDYEEMFYLKNRIESVKSLDIISKLIIKKKKAHKPIELKYKKCYLKIKYLYVGMGCIYVPKYQNNKLIFYEINVPIYLITELEEG